MKLTDEIHTEQVEDMVTGFLKRNGKTYILAYVLREGIDVDKYNSELVKQLEELASGSPYARR